MKKMRIKIPHTMATGVPALTAMEDSCYVAGGEEELEVVLALVEFYVTHNALHDLM